jgi:ligand-binding sensor domain-containing protein
MNYPLMQLRMKQVFGFVSLLILAINVEAIGSQRNEPAIYKPRFEQLTLPQGSLGNCVQDILQDSIGFMWFATQGGLHRFDGQNFISYNHDPNDPNSLLSNYIEDILLDRSGNIWMTHWSGGVTCFQRDKGRFLRYSHDPNDTESLLPGENSALAKDHAGYIWIGGQRGLNRLDPETGKVKRFQYDVNDTLSLSCNEVRNLYIDKRGTLWVGTGLPWNDPEQLCGGLNRYNPATESFTRYIHDPSDSFSLINNKVRGLLEDSKGNFWVGTGGDGLHMMDRENGTFKRYTYDPDNPNKLARPYLKRLNPITTPIHSHITSIYEDRSGKIWIAAIQGGLNIFDPATSLVHHFEMGPGEDDLTTNFLWQIFQSRDGTIWVASGGEGQAVFKIKEHEEKIPFISIAQNENDSIYYSHGIIKDNSGTFWIGQSHDDLPARVLQIDRHNGILNSIYPDDPQASPIFIGGLYLDSERELWAGTDRGYFIIDKANGNYTKYWSKDLPDTLFEKIGVRPILHARDGNLWIPVADIGLIRYNPDTGEFQIFSPDKKNSQSISGKEVFGLYEDEEGSIWVGGGTPWYNPDKHLFLDKFDPVTNAFEHFLPGGIQHGTASNINSDSNGNIWFIDFRDGLYRLDPKTKVLKKFTAYNSLLPSGQLLSLTKSQNGNFWICAENEIIKMDPIEETLSIYHELHGVVPSRGSFNLQSIVGKDGELFFARQGGFHAFYPDQLFSSQKNKLPDLRITGFRLFDEQIINSRSYFEEGILEDQIWETSKINLKYDQNIFTFSLACFDFYEPEDNQIRSRMAQ